ncbi:DUF3427 domain-containing protein [Rhodobacteraceae bacterium CH30]|nr:DUF3427 domain-containing protein [Rhodobacteraceae bacterium CH30]
MPRQMPEGLYDILLTESQARKLDDSDVVHPLLAGLEEADSHERLAEMLGRELAGILQELKPEGDSKERPPAQLALINGLLQDLRTRLHAIDSKAATRVEALASPPRVLRGLFHRPHEPELPQTGLAMPWLFTAGKASPSLLTELRRELASCDRVDILVSFITVSGVRKLADVLERITALGADGLARTRIRVLTTTYIGATDAAALDQLARLPGCEVRVSLDGRRTRLHAKAWIFERKTGFGSAYVGSANLSGAALMGGLEWTVKFTERGQRTLFGRARAHFETLWEDTEFQRYHPDEEGQRAALDRALREQKGLPSASDSNVVPFFDLQPKSYQQEMLEALASERAHGRIRNLLVAATGTGKTMIAAFDYRRLCRERGGRPRLLFVAHRIEILQQAMHSFRAVLGDNGFGEVLNAETQPGSYDHLFASIQTLDRRDLLTRFGADYWHMVIIDECHHLAAAQFDRFASAVKPAILLGLTATPERSDGSPIDGYFDHRPDGSPAAELRLWHALDLQLLAPFEYYACDDDTDLSQISWGKAGEREQLSQLLDVNSARAHLVLREWRRLCADPSQSKALVFCVSIAHAHFMTEMLNRAGLPAVCVSSESSKEERHNAPRLLAAGKIVAIVTVDLYNEGVDLPMVDTLLLLRPTQSPVLFQQQIGRGLRLFEGKESCLILDFVGQHRAEFRFDRLLGSLTGLSRRELQAGAEQGFDRLPSGCHIQLQKKTREQVLRNLKTLLNQRWPQLSRELVAYAALHRGQALTLSGFLHEQVLELEDVYRGAKGRSGWTCLKRAAGLLPEPAGSEEDYFGQRFGDLLHVDDPRQLALMEKLASGEGVVSADQGLRLQMLAYQVDGQGSRVGSGEGFLARLDGTARQELGELAGLLQARSSLLFQPIPGLEDTPLCLHASYQQREILTACGYWDATRRPFFAEGVLRLKACKTELLFVTLDKSAGYHDAIAYHDYAISPTLFHWQTQNSAGPDTKTGRCYLASVGEAANGWTFQLFVRENKQSPYRACGGVTLEAWSGSKPMNITWRLQTPLPAALFRAFNESRDV